MIHTLGCLATAALASACGPTLVDGPFGDGSASGSGEVDDGGTEANASASATASVTATDTATATATDTATDTATNTATNTATDTATNTATDTATNTATDTADASTGADGPTSAISMVGCQDDGTVSWLVELYVLAPIDGCVPPADVDLTELLFVAIDAWNGEGGTFVVGEGSVSASYDLEPLTGMMTLEVSAPYHPGTVEYDLAGASSTFLGTVDLTACNYVDELPCDAATTGG